MVGMLYIWTVQYHSHYPRGYGVLEIVASVADELFNFCFANLDLNSQMWLVATMLDSEGLKRQQLPH